MFTHTHTYINTIHTRSVHSNIPTYIFHWYVYVCINLYVYERIAFRWWLIAVEERKTREEMEKKREKKTLRKDSVSRAFTIRVRIVNIHGRRRRLRGISRRGRKSGGHGEDCSG